MNTEIIVENVKYYCLKKGVKPTIACEESGAGKNMLSQIKKGIMPSIEKIANLAAYLDVTVSDILGDQKLPPSRVESGQMQPMNDMEHHIIQIARELDPNRQALLLWMAELVANKDNPHTPQVLAGVPGLYAEAVRAEGHSNP